jgi:hypothetical protein
VAEEVEGREEGKMQTTVARKETEGEEEKQWR